MRLHVQNLGPIAKADVTFGDLTILVGPQATGKSIFLQTLKLVRDYMAISDDLDDNGFHWRNSRDYLDLFYGEGMRELWSKNAKVSVDDQRFDLDTLVDAWENYAPEDIESHVMYIPASRASVITNGWPKPFASFDPDDPYVLKKFGEDFREDVLIHPKAIAKFGLTIKNPKLAALINDSIYGRATLLITESGKRRRLALSLGGTQVPFMIWSTGQREFTPLLVVSTSLLLLGKQVSRVDTVIIEEPEMGLHPKAIQAFLLLVLELIANGYRVILSTHSPVVLEMAWALTFLKKGGAAPADVAKLFEVEATDELKPLFEKALASETKVYYFDRTEPDGRVRAKDISELDAESEDPGIAEWGGLSEFASRASAVVSQVMAKYWSTHMPPEPHA